MRHTDEDQAPSFVLAQQTPDFWWTVKIPVPADHEYRHATLDVLFHPEDQEALDRMRGLNLADGEAPATDSQIAHQVVRGWKLADPQGQPVPFSAAALDQVLRTPMARVAIVGTYLAVMTGVAARKNA